MMEEALRCRPNEEEIEAKRRELLEYYSNLHLNQNN
jgi:hypothetical protein